MWLWYIQGKASWTEAQKTLGYSGVYQFVTNKVRKEDAELARKLGQLQPFLAVLPPECMGQRASSGPT